MSDQLIEALDRIVAAINSNTAALRSLGTGDAGTTMGAIEYLAVTIKRAGEGIEAALYDDVSHGGAIADALEALVKIQRGEKIQGGE